MSLKVKSIHLFLNQTILTSTQVIILICASYWLEIKDYGIYRQFLLITETSIPILGLGLNISIYYFLTKYENHITLLKKVLNFILGIIIVLFLLYLLNIGNFFSNIFNSEEISGLFVYVIPYIALMILLPILHAFFIHNNITKLLFWINSSLAIIYLLITVWGLFYNRTPFFLVLSRILYLGITCVALIWLLYSKFYKKINNVIENYSLKDLIYYSLPIGMATIIGIVSLQVTRFIVSTNYSIEEFAIYSNGAFEIPFIGLITSTITMVSLSELIKLCESNKLKNALDLFHKIAEGSALFIFPIAIFFYIYSSDFIQLMFGSKYTGSTIFFKIFLIIVPFRIILYGPILIALGKRHVLLYRSVWELIINIILSLLLMQFFGLIGIAISTVISAVLWNIPYNLYYIKKGFACKTSVLLPYKRLGSIFMISILCILPVILFSTFVELTRLLKILTSSTLYFLLIGVAYLGFNLISIADIKKIMS